jgi:hypothetical protein
MVSYKNARFDKKNFDIVEVNGNIFKILPYKEILNPMSTGSLTVTFLKSDNGLYLYRVSGGCITYKDNLFGPFVLKDGKFVKSQ